MAISNKQIKHLAKLSRLQVNDKEAKILKKQVDDILIFISQLSEVNTSDVRPAYYQLTKDGVARADIIFTAEERDQIINGMSDVENGLLKTPKIFK